MKHKTFTVYQNKEGTKYRLEYTYKNPFDTKVTKRSSYYYSEAEVLKAAKRFQENGYVFIKNP